LLHASSCGRCAERFASEQRLNDCLDSLQVQMQGEAARPAVESILLGEFRRRHEATLSVANAAPAGFGASKWLLAAAAIIVVFALALVGLRLKSSSGQAASQQAASHDSNSDVQSNSQPTPEEPRVAVSGPQEKDSTHQDRIFKHKARRFFDDTASSTQRPNQTGGGEIATEFFPINGVADLSDVESTQVLRVELPRSALLSFGLPINPNREDERVKADVVVGTDGFARAIRFVR